MENNIQFLPHEDLNPHYVLGELSETVDWGLISTGVTEAHKFTKGKGIVVAVLDTGAYNHIDLKDNLLPGIDCTGRNNSVDQQGHGTHVSGIISASENGFGIIGVAPECKILPIKVLDNSGLGGFDIIENGIRQAIANNVDIINLSLGAPVEPPTTFHDAIKEAYNKGIIIVAAAGNDAHDVNWPAKYDEVIAVAAIDQNGQLANFSSHGSRVDIEAPGVDIYSTYINDQYALLRGTSQASPFICGICALLLSHQRSNPDESPITNAHDMLKILEEISDQHNRLNHIGKDADIGFGVPSFLNHMPWKH